jgi:four helix bundle protein
VARFADIEDMEVWQKSRQLVNRIYRITKTSLFSRDFVLCNQIRKTSISIPSNIAEGFERNGNKEFINFLSIAKGSTGELKTQLYIASDQGYISEVEFRELMHQANEVARMIGGLMKYMRQSNMKGVKFLK